MNESSHTFFGICLKIKKLIKKESCHRGYGVAVLSIIISLIEVFGISLIMPFVQIAMDFGYIHTNQYFSYIYQKFNFVNEYWFVVSVGIGLIGFYIFRTLLSMLYFYGLSKYTAQIYHEVAVEVFEKTLRMPYQFFRDKNSAHITQAIISEAKNVASILEAVITMAGEISIVILIYGMMFYINWELTLVLTLFMTINALLLKITLTTLVTKAGQDRSRIQKKFYEVLNSSLGNFKFIKLRSLEERTINELESESAKLSVVSALSQTAGHVPRLYLETLGFVTVLLMIIYWVAVNQESVADKMGLLSLFIIALYRMMPSFNRIITKYNQVMFLAPAVDFVCSHRDHVIESTSKGTLSFRETIQIKDIYFAYDTDRPILNSISFDIEKGDKIAFVGESGAGKSTLVDIIMGLLEPQKGKIRVDGVDLDAGNKQNWRQKFGYIPQDIYLFDGTVAQNIAFSMDEQKINRDRVRDVLDQAQIMDFLETNLNGIDTQVGEGGAKLSGGQKQRIAIARALYSDPEILVLDEATSALDPQTEKAIMQEIYKIAEHKTLLIIAHRLSTIAWCDKIITVANGEILTQVNNQRIIKK